MSRRLIVLTADINFGKTSALMQWLGSRDDVGGFLTPDIDGLRKIFRIRDRKLFDFQIDDSTNTDEEIVEVGRFKFLSSGFEMMNDLLLEDMGFGHEIVLVDELGKLELRDEGLCNSIHKALELFRRTDNRTSLVIVIRDFLLAEAREKFNLDAAEIYVLAQDRIFEPGF